MHSTVVTSLVFVPPSHYGAIVIHSGKGFVSPMVQYLVTLRKHRSSGLAADTSKASLELGVTWKDTRGKTHAWQEQPILYTDWLSRNTEDTQ